MTAHMSRQRTFITSYYCKTGRHGKECDDFGQELTELGGATEPLIRCHCTCHPQCDRPQCVKVREMQCSSH
jgi:hypothetical protein